jgi:chemotaxis protein methyltransferase CheR
MTEVAWSSEYSTIAEFLGLRAGLSFDPGQRDSIDQAIRQAMQHAGCSKIEDYLRLLNSDSDAFDELLLATTDSDTYFFRDAAQFRVVSELILPDIRRRRGPGHTTRIWSAGCASGEEAYSLAMLLHRNGALSQASILGTDISLAALARARAATYRESSLRGEGTGMAKPYLTHRAGQYRVNATIKRSVRFEHLNLALGNYPSTGSGTRGIDLIFCRNVLSNFDEQTIQLVVGRLFRSLAEGGWLIIASDDPPVFEYEAFDFVPTDHGLAYRRANLSCEESTPFADPPASEALDVTTSRVVTKADAKVSRVVTRADAKVSRVVTRAETAAGSKATKPFGSKARAEARKALADGDFQRAADLTTDLRGDGAIIHIKAMSSIDVARAEQACVVATKRRPFSQELQYLYAVVLMDLNRHKEAAESLRRVLYLDGSLARVHFSLGTTLRRLGDVEEAQLAFRSAVEICDRASPDQPVPLGEDETMGELRALAKTQLEAIR